MTQLEEIQKFINSPAYKLLTEDVKQELYNIEQDLYAKEYDEACKDLIRAFKEVHRNKTKGCYAPHKPVMLLTVIDLISTGHINSTTVYLDKELKQRFKEIWEQYVPAECSFKCEYRNPFTYLDHEPFWHLCDDKNTAILSDVAFECMGNAKKREIFRNRLIWMIKNETLPHSLHVFSIKDESSKSVVEKMLSLTPIISTTLMPIFA